MSLRTSPDLSVVIVNWNTRSLLEQCLRSVPQGVSSDHSVEIWVADNASSDNSASMVANSFPEVQLIANTENVGFARANNQALRLARGRHALLLNSDTKVLPGALSAMVDYLDRHSDVGAVGCRLLNADGSVQKSAWSAFPSLGSIAAEAFWLNRLPLLNRTTQASERILTDAQLPVQVKHLLGACLMVRGEALKQVGTLDEDYFMYLEETDWCHRIDAAGWRIVYLPGAEVIHYGQQSAALAPDKANTDWCRSICRYYRSRYRPGPGGMALLKSIIGIRIFLRFALSTARWATDRKKQIRSTLSGCMVALRALARA